MMELSDYRRGLFQWDTGRSLIVTEKDITEVHFQLLPPPSGSTETTDVPVTEGIAQIPDELLQVGLPLRAYAWGDGYSHYDQTFCVTKREKPTGYASTPADAITLESVQAKLQAEIDGKIGLPNPATGVPGDPVILTSAGDAAYGGRTLQAAKYIMKADSNIQTSRIGKYFFINELYIFPKSEIRVSFVDSETAESMENYTDSKPAGSPDVGVWILKSRQLYIASVYGIGTCIFDIGNDNALGMFSSFEFTSYSKDYETEIPEITVCANNIDEDGGISRLVIKNAWLNGKKFGSPDYAVLALALAVFYVIDATSKENVPDIKIYANLNGIISPLYAIHKDELGYFDGKFFLPSIISTGEEHDILEKLVTLF